MAVHTLRELLAQGVSGRGVLVRSDLNVPLDDTGNITDAGRITASVPTLKALLDAGAKVVVTAHLGRPTDGPNPKFSLAPVAAALSEQLGQHVQLAGDDIVETAFVALQRSHDRVGEEAMSAAFLGFLVAHRGAHHGGANIDVRQRLRRRFGR